MAINRRTEVIKYFPIGVFQAADLTKELIKAYEIWKNEYALNPDYISASLHIESLMIPEDVGNMIDNFHYYRLLYCLYKVNSQYRYDDFKGIYPESSIDLLSDDTASEIYSAYWELVENGEADEHDAFNAAIERIKQLYPSFPNIEYDLGYSMTLYITVGSHQLDFQFGYISPKSIYGSIQRHYPMSGEDIGYLINSLAEHNEVFVHSLYSNGHNIATFLPMFIEKYSADPIVYFTLDFVEKTNHTGDAILTLDPEYKDALILTDFEADMELDLMHHLPEDLYDDDSWSIVYFC